VKIDFTGEDAFAGAFDQLCAALDLDVAWHLGIRRDRLEEDVRRPCRVTGRGFAKPAGQAHCVAAAVCACESLRGSAPRNLHGKVFRIGHIGATVGFSTCCLRFTSDVATTMQDSLPAG
jgi:hypothetical protein